MGGWPIEIGERRQWPGFLWQHPGHDGGHVSRECRQFLGSLDLLEPVLLEQHEFAGGELPELLWQQAQLYEGYVIDCSPEGFWRIFSRFCRSFSRAASQIGIEEGSDVSR